MLAGCGQSEQEKALLIDIGKKNAKKERRSQRLKDFVRKSVLGPR